MSATAQQPAYEWQDLPWRKLEAQVFKLQRRIFNASQRGDTKTGHQLERLLMHSWAAKCLAVRKVTQDNRGKKTAGVDGVKNLTPMQRLQLTVDLRPQATARPCRSAPGPTRRGRNPVAQDGRSGIQEGEREAVGAAQLVQDLGGQALGRTGRR